MTHLKGEDVKYSLIKIKRTIQLRKNNARAQIRILRDFPSLGLIGPGIHSVVSKYITQTNLGRRNQIGAYNKHSMKGI